MKTSNYSNLKIIFSLLLTLQVTFGSPFVFGYQAPPIYSIPVDLENILMNSDPGTYFQFTHNGETYGGHFAGIFDKNTFQACTHRTESCLPFSMEPPIYVGPATGDTKEFIVTEPGDPNYISPESLQANAGTGSENLPPGMGEGSGPGFSLGEMGLDIASSAGVAALQAGVGAAIINSFGAKQLDAAQAQLNKAKYELDDIIYGYKSSVITTAAQAGQLAKTVQGIKNIAIPQSTGQFQLVENKINVAQLRFYIEHFDADYRSRIESVSERINSAPVQNHEKSYDYRSIGRDAVRASVESRTLGLIDVSDAQLKIAETMADLLYGIDPVTGLHRGLYEIYTGKNIITGRPLSGLEQAMSGASAILGLTTLGILPGVGRAFKAVSMIAKGGIKNNFNTTINASRNIVYGLAGAGVASNAELKIAEKLIKKGIIEGSVKNADDIIAATEKAVAGGIIKKLPFKKEFVNNPTSNEALKFIQKEISTGGIKAKNIYPGNTDEVYIIGRKMGDPALGKPGVITYANEMVKTGFDRNKIHVFDEWSKIDLARAKEEIVDKTVKNGGKWLDDSQLAKTEMAELNSRWMEKAIGSESSRPTIIVLERNPHDGPSFFLDQIELSKLKESGRLPWN